MIEKKDFETALKQFEGMFVNNTINNMFHEACIEVCKKKLAEFPVEEVKDPMPAEIKDLLKEAAK